MICDVCGSTFDPPRYSKRSTCSKACRYRKVSATHKRLGTKPPGLDPEVARRMITGSNAPWWKGGRAMTSSGYVRVIAPDGFPFPEMIDTAGRIREHRMVMALHLERPLARREVVHHINGDRTDNRIENLALHASHSDHMRTCHGRPSDGG